MTKTELIIKLLSISGIGCKNARKLTDNLSPKVSTDNDLIDYLLLNSSKSRLKLDRSIIKTGIEKAYHIISKSQRLGISFIDFQSALYPTLLKEIDDPPLLLTYKGNIEILKSNCIAIIGVREPTPRGHADSYNCGKLVAKEGFAIVSGLAKGCDTVAHKGCLVAGGKAIAVVGNGLDIIYPMENTRLLNEILESGGLVISESFVGQKPSRGLLLQRNRIIAGIIKKLLVVEVGERGGTLYTSNLCLKTDIEIGCITHINEDRPGNLRLLANPEVIPLFCESDINHFIKPGTLFEK